MTGKARRGRQRPGDADGQHRPAATDPAPAAGSADEAPDPMEAFAEAILANPEIMQRRLEADLAQVAALGRGEVRVDPALPAERLVLAIREHADRLAFDTPVASAVAAKEHIDEVPFGERESGEPIPAYHRSASLTVANGEVVREHAGYDGSINLVFHRRAAEPNHTATRLETVVAVRPDGLVHLAGHGWPTIAVEQPVHSFDGSAEGYAEQLLVDLQASVKRTEETAPAEPPTDPVAAVLEGDDPVGRGLFERAMLMAFGFTIAQHRDGYLPADRLLRYQEEVVTLVARSAALLAAYVEGAFDLAEQGGIVGWTGACVRRSAAEGLFAGFLGSAAFELIDPELLTELHEAIDDAAEALARPGRAPEGLPRYNHDWWFPGRRR